MRTSRDSAVAAGAPVIAALDMGYGHLRAAASIASACGGEVTLADRPPVATAHEARLWLRARRLYESLSRAADAWYVPGARRLLDLVTGIPAVAGGRDDSAPNLAVRQLDGLVRDGLGKGLAARLLDRGDPLVATFYAPAIAAAAHGARRVHLVVTDSDVNRIWAPRDPARSRIVYLAPTETAAARLRSYGIAPDLVRVTGFPLPPELTGDDLRVAVAARLARLDPGGAFRAAHADEIRERLGDIGFPAAAPPTIVFAVGGAGAQAGVARRLLSALRAPLARGDIRLVLVAGTRRRVADRFEEWIAAARLGPSVSVLFEPDFPAYYRRFNETLAAADALWTKPSELTFYGALGLPLLLARPLGVHERRNRTWATGLGAAIDAEDSGAVAARLPSLLADGSLAAAAWAGFTRMPRDGASRIVDAVRRS